MSDIGIKNEEIANLLYIEMPSAIGTYVLYLDIVMQKNKTCILFQLDRNEKALIKTLAKRVARGNVSAYIRLRIEQDARLAGLIPPTQ